MDIEKIEREYRTKFPFYEDFATRLKDLLKSLLKPVNYHLVECRAKDINSFCEKVKRKKDKYSNPIDDITDKVGLRIILYYPKDVDIAIRIIRENFIVDEPNSFDAKEKLSEDEFGYLSTHIVVTINDNRNTLPEWVDYKNIKAEIQIRTVLQHAWAAISHELEYKKEYDIPSVMKRPLYRMAGLIELADQEFERISIEHEKVNIAIIEKQEINNVKVYEEISLDSVRNYMNKENKTIIEINKKAESAGFTSIMLDLDDIIINNTYSDIILITKILGIKTITELNLILEKQTSKMDENFNKIFKTSSSGEWSSDSPFNVELTLLTLLNKKQIQIFEKQRNGWHDDIWNRVKLILTHETKSK